jgi:hypothetical protein
MDPEYRLTAILPSPSIRVGDNVPVQFDLYQIGSRTRKACLGWTWGWTLKRGEDVIEVKVRQESGPYFRLRRSERKAWSWNMRVPKVPEGSAEGSIRFHVDLYKSGCSGEKQQTIYSAETPVSIEASCEPEGQSDV